MVPHGWSRISKCLALLLVCFSMIPCARADAVPARILIGTSEAPLAPAPVFDGAGVLAPLQIVSMLGASYTDSSDGDLIVIAAGGQSGNIRTVDVNGTRMVPMDKLISLIGGERSWNVAKHTLTLIAYLESVEFENDTLKINCSFPVRVSAKLWGGKITVDVANAKVASEAKEVYIGAPAVSKARLGQYDRNTARVVLELNKTTGYKIESEGAASQILLKIGDGLVPEPTAPTQTTAKQPSAQSFTITGVAVQKVDERSFNIAISTSAKATVATALGVSPPEIRVDLPGGRVDESSAITGSHSFVKPELIKTGSGARLSLRLSRPMAYSVEVRNTETMIYVRPPDKSGGTLAGKVVVIDPGHGGKECGAQAGGCSEKNVNMQLAKQLATALAKYGVHTILTRDSDDQMGLAARPQIAIDASADFFISLHCNSNVSPGSATGIETYYHMQEASPKLLAYAIHDGVCKFTGMCDRHPRSDRSLYASGLGVLRRLEGTGLPGILVECGYVNNSSDRAKLLDSGYRAKLAAGIVAGLKAYIEGTPIQ
jgi:N-acetylmuramoyl-L-alanine amidase